MMETLQALAGHLGQGAERSKVVVWSHNLHVGDARAADLGKAGRISLGQLAREQWGKGVALIGFTTDSGTVTAAPDWWDSPPTCAPLKPATQDSYEGLFHQTGCRRFVLNLRQSNRATAGLRTPRAERSVGVVYRPDSERTGQYFEAILPEQFDAVIHIDETRAVEPLERTRQWAKGDVPQTFPAGV
jgi:erythromycin esterase-like protein